MRAPMAIRELGSTTRLLRAFSLPDVGPAPGARVVVIGGGFTGAAVALHLARRTDLPDLVVTVIEPRAFLGGGLAYSTPEPSHRVNVPVVRMSIYPDDPENCARWLAESGELERDPDAIWSNGDAYPSRRVFGRYVEHQLAPYLANGRIRHLRAMALRVGKTGDRWRVEVSTCETIQADIVVLAASHPNPAVPEVLSGVRGYDGFVADPYNTAELWRIGKQASVLIVGSGLSAADMVAELDWLGHSGRILSLSRHGLRSRAHPKARCQPFGEFATMPSTTALELLKRIRATVAAAERSGTSWHAVFDKLRAQGASIWSALPPSERATLVRWLRVFWDVHRFRVGPQVEALLTRREGEGTFENIAASLVGAERHGGRFAVQFRKRGKTVVERQWFDAIINTTGPAHRTALTRNPALRSLATARQIRQDRYALGIDTSEDSRAISSTGEPATSLFVAGPLARGTFGELMGVPEVARHAQAVANEVAALLGESVGTEAGSKMERY